MAKYDNPMVKVGVPPRIYYIWGAAVERYCSVLRFCLIPRHSPIIIPNKYSKNTIFIFMYQ